MNAGPTKAETELLRDVISRRSPKLLPLLDTVAQGALTNEEREELRGVVLDELVEHGLGEDDEPNEHGHTMERLIDALGHQ